MTPTWKGGYGGPRRDRTDDLSHAMDFPKPYLSEAKAFFYLKAKNFDWHMSGPHFRDYHLLLDDHADQIFAMTDDIVLEPPSAAGIASRSKRGPLSKGSTTQTFEDAVG